MRVSDVMQRDIVAVTPETSVQELLNVLADRQISGVPVVGDGGAVVGVVSATDVIRLVAQLEEIPAGDTLRDVTGIPEEEMPHAWATPYFLELDRPVSTARDDVDALGTGPLDETTVGDIMTPAAFTVTPETTVLEVARFLLGGRIHRALVVEGGQLRGVVSTFDLLRGFVAETDGRIG